MNILVEYSLGQLLVAFLLAAIIAAFALRLGALSGSGYLAASILGGVIYGLGGLIWATLLLAFFASSSLLSRLFKFRKATIEAQFEKGGQRDWAQVAANGGPGLILLILAFFGFLSQEMAWAGYAASLAVVTADTWATELGILNKAKPRLITTWKKVEGGTSGGLSLTGSFAALLGAFIIAGLAVLLANVRDPLIILFIVTGAGFGGAFIDSFLGATVQSIYFCPHCQKETERHPFHTCGTKTIHFRGWAWMTNDWVNFISSIAGAGLAMLLLAGLMSVG